MGRILILIGICGLLISCGDTDKVKNNDGSGTPRIRKVSRLESPKNGSSYPFTSGISFDIISESVLDSVSVEYRGTRELFTSGKFSWIPENPRTGNLKVRVTVYFGGESDTHFPRIIMTSDIAPKPMTYIIQSTHPHNPEAYTQGLFFKGDTLIESTGQNGTSWISKVNIATGQPYLKATLDDQYFGEGSAYWNGTYYQLTWTSQIGFTYDDQFQKKGTFQYTHQGWGMATWGDTLLVSDGSEVIRLVDPRDFSEIDRLEVYLEDEPLESLNELEVIDGKLYANLYPDDEVAVIELATGRVLELVDFSGLLTSQQRRNADAFNGIAQHPASKKIYVTGKLWPTLFEIKLSPKPQ